MNWIDEDKLEIIENFDTLDEDTKISMLEDICDSCVGYLNFPTFNWNKYGTLVKLLPYAKHLPEKMREKFVQAFGGIVLDCLDTCNFENNYILDDTDIPFLFELKNVVATFDSETVESKFIVKNINITIKQLLQAYDNIKFEYIELFFDKLSYPYTRESLKKCKNEIIKENHPDNGGSGEYIQIVQSVYKTFLDRLDIFGK